jgi:serine/threonine protein kinase
VEANPYTARALKLELAIHQSLKHPHIVLVDSIVQTNNNYYVFQEYCEQGTLRQVPLPYPAVAE